MASWEILRNRRARVVLALGTGVAIVGASAVAVSLADASTPTTSTLTACESHGGTLRLVASATLCSSDETVVQWNVVGPTGPTGATGPQGPAGPTGPAATASIPGTQVVGTLTIADPSSSGTLASGLTTNLYSVNVDLKSQFFIGTQSSGSGAGKVTFNTAQFTLPVGPTSLAITKAMNDGRSTLTASVVLFEPNSTTTAETLNLGLVGVQDVTTTNNGAATSSPQVVVTVGYGSITTLLP